MRCFDKTTQSLWGKVPFLVASKQYLEGLACGKHHQVNQQLCERKWVHHNAGCMLKKQHHCQVTTMRVGCSPAYWHSYLSSLLVLEQHCLGKQTPCCPCCHRLSHHAPNVRQPADVPAKPAVMPACLAGVPWRLAAALSSLPAVPKCLLLSLNALLLCLDALLLCLQAWLLCLQAQQPVLQLNLTLQALMDV